VDSQYVHPKHPPDKEYCDDSPRDVDYPIASCFGFPKVEHAAMVAGPRELAVDFGVVRHPPMIGNRRQHQLACQPATALRTLSLGNYGELGEAIAGAGGLK
jgi:hypothetical protein